MLLAQICGYIPTFRQKLSAPNFQRKAVEELDLIIYLESSVTDYQCTLHNIPEE
jgi:hypothetical protein